jgi:hypothetical protein
MSSAATTLTAPASGAPNNGAPNGAPDGGTPQDWRASLPEEIRGEESIKNFKDVADLTKGFIETKKLVGNATKIPKADAKPEEWDAFHAKLGRPESADKYEIKVPEGAKWDDATDVKVKELFFKAGLPPRQAQALVDGYNAMQTEQLAAYAKSLEGGVAELKRDPNFSKNAEIAQATIKEFGSEEFSAFLSDPTMGSLGNHPLLVKFAINAGNQITELRNQNKALKSEDKYIDGDAATEQGTKDAILAKIEAIESDPKHPHNDVKAHYDVRQAAHREVAALYKQAYG